MQDIAFAMAATDDDVNLEMSQMPTFSLGLDFLDDPTEDNEQQSFLKNTNPMKQQQTQQKQESKFTKIVSPHRSGGPIDNMFNFKSSSPASIQPVGKEFNNSTMNTQTVTNIFSSAKTPSNNTTVCGSVSNGSSGRSIICTESTTGCDIIKQGITQCVDTNINDRGRNFDGTNSTPNSTLKSTPNSTPKSIPRAYVSVSINIIYNSAFFFYQEQCW
jgi:hypothetical protein